MSPTGRPFSRPFFLRIKHVQYEDDSRKPASTHGPDFYWRPSLSGHFTVQHSSAWWIWDPGQIQSAQFSRLRQPTQQEIAHAQTHRTCTMIWDPDRHGYLLVPTDCTTTKMTATDIWRRLSFGHDDVPNRAHIALIGLHRDDYHLHLPGPDHWFEELLPVVCNKSPTFSPQRCTLAGYLSILVGLTAFSSAPEYAEWAVDLSFRKDVDSTTFKPNLLPKSPSTERRIMVIEIAYDPNKVTAAELRAWENGEYGEIFS